MTKGFRDKLWSSYEHLQKFLKACADGSIAASKLQSAATKACEDLDTTVSGVDPHMALSSDDLVCINEFIVKPAAARVLNPSLLHQPGGAPSGAPADLGRAAAVIGVQQSLVVFLWWVDRASRTAPNHDAFMAQLLYVISNKVEYVFWMNLAKKEDCNAAKKVVRNGNRPPVQDPFTNKHRQLTGEAQALPYLLCLADTPALLTSWLEKGVGAGSDTGSIGASANAVSGSGSGSGSLPAAEQVRCFLERAGHENQSAHMRDSAVWLACQLLNCPDDRVTQAVRASLSAVDWVPIWRLWLDPRVTVGAEGWGCRPKELCKQQLVYCVPRFTSKAKVFWSDGSDTSVSGSGKLERSDELWPLLAAALQAMDCSDNGGMQSAILVTASAHAPVGVVQDVPQGSAGQAHDALRALGLALQRLPASDDMQHHYHGHVVAPSVAADLRSVRQMHLERCFVEQLLPFLSRRRPAVLVLLLSEVLASPSTPRSISAAVAESYGRLALEAVQATQARGMSLPLAALHKLWLAQEAGFHTTWTGKLLTELTRDGSNRSCGGPSVGAADMVQSYGLLLLLTSLWHNPPQALHALDLATWGALKVLCERCTLKPPGGHGGLDSHLPPTTAATMMVVCLLRAAEAAAPSAPLPAQAQVMAVLLHALAQQAIAACEAASEEATIEAVDLLAQLATALQASVLRSAAALGEWHAGFASRASGGVFDSGALARSAKDVAEALLGVSSLGSNAPTEVSQAVIRAVGAMTAGPRAFALRRALLSHNGAAVVGSLRQILSFQEWRNPCEDLVVALLMRICGAAGVPQPAAPGEAAPVVNLPAIIRNAVVGLVSVRHLPAVLEAPLGALEMDGRASVVVVSCSRDDDGDEEELPVCAKYLNAVVDSCGSDATEGLVSLTLGGGVRNPMALSNLMAMAGVLARQDAAGDASSFDTDARAAGSGASQKETWRLRYGRCLPGLVRLLTQTPVPPTSRPTAASYLGCRFS